MGLVAIVTTVVSLIPNPVGGPFAVPGSAELELDDGEWVIFTEDGPPESFVGPSNVTITGSDGQMVDTEGAASVVELMEVDGVAYTGAVAFDVPSPGTWTVAVDDVNPGNVQVARSAATDPLVLIGTGFLALLGAVLVVLGIIVAAIGWARRRNVG